MVAIPFLLAADRAERLVAERDQVAERSGVRGARRVELHLVVLFQRENDFRDLQAGEPELVHLGVLVNGRVRWQFSAHLPLDQSDNLVSRDHMVWSPFVLDSAASRYSRSETYAEGRKRYKFRWFHDRAR